jgi:hypothetical protein
MVDALRGRRSDEGLVDTFECGDPARQKGNSAAGHLNVFERTWPDGGEVATLF